MWHKQDGHPKLSFMGCASSEGVEDEPVGQ